MKSEFDIELKTLHIGDIHRVVTLRLHGSDTAEAFLIKLKKKNQETFDRLVGRIKTVSDKDYVENQVQFRSLGGGLFEAKVNKPKTVRLYVFYDRTTLDMESMILAAHGGEKNSQQRDIENARKRMRHYKALLKRQETTLYLHE